MSKWVSVKDRPVPRDHRVLAIDNDGRIAVVEHKKHRYFDEEWFSAGWACSCCGGYCAFEEITHWMPLPEAPT